MNEKKNSKGYKEIFEEKYPSEKCAKNRYFRVEALGYLKCLETFLPSEKWIKEYIEAIELTNVLEALLS